MITQNIQHWSIAKCCRWLFQLKSVFIYRNHCQRINNMEFYDIFFALFCHTTQRLPDSRGHKFSQSSIRSLYITRWNNIAYRRKDRAKKKKITKMQHEHVLSNIAIGSTGFGSCSNGMAFRWTHFFSRRFNFLGKIDVRLPSCPILKMKTKQWLECYSKHWIREKKRREKHFKTHIIRKIRQLSCILLHYFAQE